MAKITRLDANVLAFASAALANERTVFGDVTESDTLDDNVTADFFRGWGIVGPNDEPTREDFNGLGFTLGQFIAYLHQVGVAEWNGNQEYHQNSLANESGVLYLCLTNSHTSVTAPSADAVNWSPLVTALKTPYDNSTSGLTADTVQDALDELVSDFVSPLDFGIGGFSVQSDDWDAIVENGIYTNGSNTSATGIPEALNQLQMIHMGSTIGNGVQIAKRVVTGSLWVRTRNSGIWSGWVNHTPIGEGQTWQDVSGSRVANTIYTNTTGRSIQVIIILDSTGSAQSPEVSEDGISWVTVGRRSSTSLSANTFTVPNGYQYRSIGGILNWVELR